MSEKYVLVTDASADLQPEFMKENDVQVIGMTYLLGDEEQICLGDEPEDVLKRYYDGVRQGKMTRTSQISPQKYIEYFREFAKKGESVLYLALSSGLSGTYDSSRLAADEVMKEFHGVTVRCVDSLSATGGMGVLLECAAKNRADGMDIEDNANWLEKNRLNLCHWFMVEDLMYLKRNGRISPTTALVGSALNVKPILRIENDGTLINFAKKRGTTAALDQLVEFYSKASEKKPGERIYIIHADNDPGASYLENAVREINPTCVITKKLLSPIIGCHTGPGMCAIVHFGQRI